MVLARDQAEGPDLDLAAERLARDPEMRRLVRDMGVTHVDPETKTIHCQVPSNGNGKQLSTAETRRSERLLAAVRYIQKQGGQDLEGYEPYPWPPEGLFDDPDDPSGWRDFLPAPDLEAIARELIDEDEALGHLVQYRVVYLWKRKGGQKAGQAVMGKCTKASGPAKHFADATWVIWLAADWAKAYELTRQQVEAALHHELTHAGEKEIEVTRPDGETDTKVVPAIRGHDAEMFRSEVERYGLWRLPLRTVAPAFRQLSLSFDGEG